MLLVEAYAKPLKVAERRMSKQKANRLESSYEKLGHEKGPVTNQSQQRIKSKLGK